MFYWHNLVEMFDEIVYGISQSGKVILDNVPNKVCVNVKITMCNTIAHTLYSFPRNFWSCG